MDNGDGFAERGRLMTGGNLETTYLEYLEADKVLHRLVKPILPDLNRLPPEQLETLIFYLKSIHNYYPASEGSSHNAFEFEKKLEEIRGSKEQCELQKRASSLVLKSQVLGVIVSLAFIAAVAAGMGGRYIWALGLASTALALLLWTERRFVVAALQSSKEQDRRYFLECLRTARSCNELDWCGFFSYNGTTRSGPQSDEDESRTHQRVAELSAHLRNALYNDEYMQYSRKRPESQADLLARAAD